MKVRYHALVRQDVFEILKYYEREAGHQVAVEFFAEFRRCIRRIANDPHSFAELRSGIRRCLLNQFPYQNNFEIVDAKELKILIIKHQRRDPDIGLER